MNNPIFPSRLVAFEATGADVFDLLDRITTNSLAQFSVGNSRDTILINEKARIVDILSLKKTSETSALVVAANFAETVAWIDRFVFTEDVTFTERTDLNVHVCPKGTSASGGEDVVEGTCVDFILSAENLATASEQELADFRSENLIGFLGYEFVDDFIPLEVGLLDAISFTKGCYIGQEVIARLDTYKKVSKYLAQIRSEQPLPDGSYNVQSAEGKRLGRLTTRGSEQTHLAIVHKSLTEPQTPVTIVSDTFSCGGAVAAALTDKTYQ